MIEWSAAALLVMAMGESAAGMAEPVQFAQIVVREQIIVRVPVRARLPKPSVPAIEWREGKKGPECVTAKNIAGASLLGQNSVDLILRDNSRIRAKLENSCPALDYYYGFYITPNADGRICADRDAIRSRMGGQCEIEKFRSLRATAKD